MNSKFISNNLTAPSITWIILFMLMCGWTQVNAQTPAQAMERIRSSSKDLYRWGEATNDSEEEARNGAMENLLMGLKSTFSLDRREKESLDNDQYNIKQTSELRAQTITTLDNLATLIYKSDQGWHCMYYVSVSDLKAAEETRRSHIIDMVNLGIEQEGKTNIAAALKYYTWALYMLRAYNDNVNMELEGRVQSTRPWLQQHIPMVLDNISVSLANNQIDYDELDYDHYTVNLELKYAGNPVSSVDIGYFNGQREIKPVHAKNGVASIRFHDLSNFSEIALKIIYDYPEEGKLYDNELKAVYNTTQRVSFDTHGHLNLPIKIKKDRINLVKKDNNQPDIASSSTLSTQPIVKPARKTIERPEIQSDSMIKILNLVEKSLRSRDYTSVKNLFTDEGWDIFQQMTNAGELRVINTPENYTIESSKLFTIGKGIPVTVKNGKHSSNETIVFRFDKELGLIKSVAYALSKRAEDDIFRQAQWDIESRYSLLTFMEDYQTAFALKRLDYIKSIFSDDAVIITGKFADNKTSKRFYDMEALQLSGRNVIYSRYNKDEYIKRLENDFFDKNSKNYRKYIQLVFEDAVISKVSTGGFVDNDVMWIEIKQQYNSDKYSDKGFLALQINLKPTGSQIHVRTWTPQFMDIDELKKRFNVGF